MTEFSVPFRWTFPYRSLQGRAATPVIPVTLLLGDYRVEFLALVDTGAERSLLDGIHLRTSGRDIFTGPALQFQGFLGATTTAYEHPARLQIETLEIELALAFSTHPLHRQVLGRDVLAHLVLGVHERALEVYLGPEQQS